MASPSPAGPVLALVQMPTDLGPAVEAAVSKVWAGRVVRVDAIESNGELPTLAVVAGHDAETAFRTARAYETRFPELLFLAVVENARKLRNQRGVMPGNVAWALWTDEFDVRVLGLAMRYVLEVGTRRRLGERLQAARPLADMGSVASAASHEIGNPLTGLLTNLELARSQLADAVDGDAAIDAAALLAVINDALDGARHISRIAADLGRASRRAGRIVPVSVTAVLDTARRLASELLQGIEVRTRYRKVSSVKVDETRLTQVLLNLLKNAAQALAGRPGGTIDVEVDQDGDKVVIRVSDNGPGIPESVARRLFEPYLTTKAEGSGIGLALSRKYLAEMGGSIEYTGRPDEGARFEIRVPAAPPTLGAHRPTLVPDRATGRVRVLVVDDTPIVRRAIQRALQPAHEVDLAEGVTEGLSRLAQQAYDIVFVDLHMPGRTGIEFYDELTERFPGRAKKVVFLSGAFDKDDLAYLEQHNLPWVRKPVGAEELRELVTELMSQVG